MDSGDANRRPIGGAKAVVLDPALPEETPEAYGSSLS
jgi:hypothetical protein